MKLVRVVISAAVVGSVAGIEDFPRCVEGQWTIPCTQETGDNGCWQYQYPSVKYDQFDEYPPCCKAENQECHKCPVPTGPYQDTCMHQWVDDEEFISCTVNVDTCAMTCGCDDLRKHVGEDRVKKMSTVDLNSCTTFDNCHGVLTCTEGPDYKGCPADPAPAPPPPPPSPPPSPPPEEFWIQRALVADEGNELKSLEGLLRAEDCIAACEADAACHSASWSFFKSRCHLKDKCVTASDASDHNSGHGDYVTYYKPCTGLSVV